MKIIAKLGILIFCIFQNTYAQDFVKIQSLINNKSINYNIKVNPKGTHYTSQFIIKILNKKNIQQNIKIEPGLLIIADSTRNQNFIITKEELISLAPSAATEIKLHTMCIENHDMAPGQNDTYKLGKLADGSLKDIALFLSSKGWYDKAVSQNAIWCISDNNEPETIMGHDETIEKELMEFVCKITGKKMPPDEILNSYKYNYHSTNFVREVGGNFEFKLSKEAEITIGMFDKNNVLVRELYNNPHETIGYHKFNYAFDASVYTDKFYYFKLLQNGEVRLNLEMEFHNEND